MPILKVWDEKNQKYIGIPAIKGETGEKGDTGPQGPQGEPGVSTNVNDIAPDETGNVTLTAVDVGALPSAGGDMTGEIRMNGQPISGLHDPTEATQAARKGYVDASVRKASPRNLLDNSDFRNPVNQRGQTSYTGDQGYTIDRWYLSQYNGSNTVTVSLGSGGITLTVASGNQAAFIQRLPSDAMSANKTYTLVAKKSDGGYLFGAIQDEVSSYGFWQLAFIVDPGTTLEWSALYEGEYTAENLPEYQPKGYGAELAACQRYYQRFSSGTQTYFVFALGYMQSATSCRFFLPLTVPMRTKPTINSPEAVYFNYGPSITRVAVSSFSVNNMLPNQVFLSAVTASDVTVGTVGEVMTTTSTGNYIELLADL